MTGHVEKPSTSDGIIHSGISRILFAVIPVCLYWITAALFEFLPETFRLFLVEGMLSIAVVALLVRRKASPQQESLQATAAQLQDRTEELAIEVAERRKMEKQAEVARQQALESVAIKDEFLAAISHEFRTPLNGIIGVTHILQDMATERKMDAEVCDLVTYLADSTATLQTLVDDVLDLSRLEDGTLTVEDAVFSPETLVETTTQIFLPLIKRKGLEMKVICTDLPAGVRGDQQRIRQILANLISNAVKFTEQGRVTVRAMMQGDSQLRLEVEDTGAGISTDRQSVIFEKFTQGDGTLSRKQGGTGIGLALCKGLCDLMQGRIGFNSTLHTGTTFYVEIPVKAVEPTYKSAKVTDENDLSTMHVLVMEDDSISQMVLMRHLEVMGVQHVTYCRSGTEGIAAAEQGAYDMIITDILMPEVDGFQATAAIRALGGPYATVPVIALTGNTSVGSREQYRSLGINDFLTKPVRQEALKRLMLRYRL